MSNALSVRRVKFQELDEQGNPVGDPTYGVIASDDYDSAYNDTFESFEELEKNIQESESILSLVLIRDKYLFDGVKHEKIGHDNYYGTDWSTIIGDTDGEVDA